jgi:hypothetical protein
MVNTVCGKLTKRMAMWIAALTKSAMTRAIPVGMDFYGEKSWTWVENLRRFVAKIQPFQNETRISNRGGSIFLICDQSDLERHPVPVSFWNGCTG